MTSIGTPAFARSEACVSRRSCKVIGVTFARATKSLQAAPKFNGVTGVPSGRAKTRFRSLYAWPRQRRSSTCLARCVRRISVSSDAITIVRASPFFGALNANPDFGSDSDSRIETVASFKLRSDHLTASTSPRRAPVYAANATAGKNPGCGWRSSSHFTKLPHRHRNRWPRDGT